MIQEAEEKILKQEYSTAAEILKKAIAANSENRPAIKAMYKLGFLSETYLKDYESALFSYNEFIKLSQDKVAVYEVLKRIANIEFDQRKDADKAIAAYKKLLEFNPQSLEGDFFQFRIANSFFRQNNFEQARIEYQTLLDHFPKSPLAARTRYEIANAHYMEGKYEIAIDSAKQVLRNHPQSEFAIEAQFLTGQCLEGQEKYTEALEQYESIASKYSSPDVVKIRIADLKKRMKDSKRATRP